MIHFFVVILELHGSTAPHSVVFTGSCSLGVSWRFGMLEFHMYQIFNSRLYQHLWPYGPHSSERILDAILMMFRAPPRQRRIIVVFSIHYLRYLHVSCYHGTVIYPIGLVVNHSYY
jgi:hypothetical protein